MAKLSFERREQLETWLIKQARETAVIIAARASLRVLPLVFDSRRVFATPLSFLELTAATFRATALAWTAARYLFDVSELGRASAAAAASRAAALASASPAAAAVSLSSASAVAAAGTASFGAYAFATDATARTAVARAIYANNDDPMPGADAPYWEATTADAQFIEDGGAVAALADRKLWLVDAPRWATQAPDAFARALPSDQNWSVWLEWYERRLRGRRMSDEYELIFATVPQELWDGEQGWIDANKWIAENLPPVDRSSAALDAAIVSDQVEAEVVRRPLEPSMEEILASIRRIIADDETLTPPKLPRPVADVASPFAYGWNSAFRISIVAGPQNIPILPFQTSGRDHEQALEASRKLFERLRDALLRKDFNVREAYARCIASYLEDLPTRPSIGNILLADAQARILRELFAADAAALPESFAAQLKIALQQHIGVRAFYPEVERFYGRVRDGRLEAPLPEDAVEGFVEAIRANTPTIFEPNVSKGFVDVEQVPPVIELDPQDRRMTDGAIAPPPDPFGHLEPKKSRSYSIASAANSLWEAFLKGKDLPEAVAGWSEVAGQMAPHAQKIIEWLEKFLSGGN